IIDVEESVSFEADVDKSGLHPRQNVFNPALVNVAYDTLFLLPLNVKLDQTPVFEERSARLAEAGVDHDLPFHKMSLLITPSRTPSACGDHPENVATAFYTHMSVVGPKLWKKLRWLIATPPRSIRE